MKLLLIRYFFFLLVLSGLNTNLLGKEINSLYKIEVGTFNLGNLNWKINIENNFYKTSLILNSKGLLSGFYSFRGEYFSEGEILNGKFVSYKYNQLWKTKRKERNVEIFFKKNKISKLILKPKENEKARVEYFKINNLVDPIASFLNILVGSKNNYKTIDGRRIYNMILNNEKKTGEIVSKKIIITNYVNIWTDHKRKDLEYISTKQKDIKNNDFFPNFIKLKNKGVVFKLTKI